MMEEIKAQIKVVVEARQAATKAIEAKKVSFAEWEEQNRELIAKATQALATVGEAEGLLRSLTVQAFKETGNKEPAPGVGIREVAILDYEDKAAFKWAVEHNMALQLNTKAFEKLVKTEPDAFDFVKITKKPQATIAADLKAVVEEMPV